MRIYKKLTLAALGLLMASVVGAQELPELSVMNKIIDLGKVPQGAVKNVVFKLKNEGTAPLMIRAARPTCGCTVADFDKEIAPGNTGEVRATLDTSGFRGPIAKSILVASNDPVNPTVALAIKADVRPFLAVYPRSILRFNVLQNQEAVQKVTVAGTERSGSYKLTGAKAESSDFSVDIRKLDEKELLTEAGQPQYEVSVRLKKGVAPGPISTNVYLSTNSKEQPQIKLQVIGVVRALLRVSPPQLQFGAVAAKLGPARNLVVVSGKGGGDIHITDASIDDPAFDLETTTVEDGKRYQIEVRVKKDAKPGVRNAKLTIQTDNSEVLSLEVPVRAAIH